MSDLSSIIDFVTMILLAIAGFVLVLFRSGTETAVKTGAEEAVKAAMREADWPKELARELQKTRGIERQELRYKSYGGLWKELRPLAIYDASFINREDAMDLSQKLSDWYFKESGGLLLTPQARDFYFALQDLLRIISKSSEVWNADRSEESEGNQTDIFKQVMATCGTQEAVDVFEYIERADLKDWQGLAASLGEKWREGVRKVAKNWNQLDPVQQFATLQQVGSILRTSLVNDLESRLT